MLTITPLVDPRLLRQAYRLRYAVFVEEQGLDRIPSANRTTRELRDPADDSGVLLGALSDGELVGCVRVNLLSDGSAAPFDLLMGLADLDPEASAATSITSRLVITPQHRRSAVAIRLARACVSHFQPLGVREDFILVREQFTSFYARMGYERHGSSVEYACAGPWTAMRLNVHALTRGFLSSPLADAPPVAPETRALVDQVRGRHAVARRVS